MILVELLNLTLENALRSNLDTKCQIRSTRLGNADFMAKAPEHIVEENRDRLATFTTRRRQLDAALGRLKELG